LREDKAPEDVVREKPPHTEDVIEEENVLMKIKLFP
jgi:hypothetical protein